MSRIHARSLCRVTLAVLLAFLAPPTLAGTPTTSINDTGQTTFYDATTSTPGGEPVNFPGQDAGFGRDAAALAGALIKSGAGDAGFDFTKIGANGMPLAIQDHPWARDGNGFDSGSEAAGTRWSCVRDNTTGLIWEVKTYRATPDLHDREWTYSWYSSAARPDGTANGNNGQNAGGENRGTCLDKYDVDANPAGNYCDTAGFVAAVNAASLCGASDWRTPTLNELFGLIHFGRHWPAIDITHFPNTPGDFGNPTNPAPNITWTGSPAVSSDSAWSVYFQYGRAMWGTYKSNPHSMRLVRSAP
ncbi:DUF1566 domain-containing protein [Xanthomonadaceae bacterium JHOS43]|nr:DUF1566 domain-containing protein [Xanthomonadaceae bacterium JHOS43]